MIRMLAYKSAFASFAPHKHAQADRTLSLRFLPLPSRVAFLFRCLLALQCQAKSSSRQIFHLLLQLLVSLACRPSPPCSLVLAPSAAVPATLASLTARLAAAAASAARFFCCWALHFCSFRLGDLPFEATALATVIPHASLASRLVSTRAASRYASIIASVSATSASALIAYVIMSASAVRKHASAHTLIVAMANSTSPRCVQLMPLKSNCLL